MASKLKLIHSHHIPQPKAKISAIGSLKSSPHMIRTHRFRYIQQQLSNTQAPFKPNA